VLFVTYCRFAPTGMIGVFKRCLRLAARLTRVFDIHWVNFGPLPESDALFSRIRGRITVHRGLRGKAQRSLAELMRRVDPAVVVLGETPRSGALLAAYRAAAGLGIRQVGIDNYYGRSMLEDRQLAWSHVDSWVLLGVHESGRPAYSLGKVHVLPPLVTVPEGVGSPPRDRICVLGYDRTTLERSLQLLRRLPTVLPTVPRVDFFLSPELAGQLRRAGIEHGRSGVALHVLPDERVLFAAMACARLIFGKSGFQQIMEGLCLGAPVVCQSATGGVQPCFLPPHLRSYYRQVNSEGDLDRLLPDLAAWVLASPVFPWTAPLRRLGDMAGYAAKRFEKILYRPRFGERVSP
jgi:hypothetical protein